MDSKLKDLFNALMTEDSKQTRVPIPKTLRELIIDFQEAYAAAEGSIISKDKVTILMMSLAVPDMLEMIGTLQRKKQKLEALEAEMQAKLEKKKKSLTL